MKKIFSTLFFILVFSTLSSACSALFIKNTQMFLGKNFDWYNGEGVVLQNKRGVQKVAYGLDKENVVGWTSRFGSVTFNQVGKEFPYGGVNERGLAIEMLWYSDSYYEESGQPTISELEWIQYNLDNYKTAAEVQFYLDSMNINPVNSNLHYLVADRGGRSFVVDFVNGKAVVSNTEEEFQALTNSNYLESLNYYKANKDNIDFDSRESADRFCQLTSKATSIESKTVDGMFSILDESREERDNYKTYWTIVYDLKNLTVYYKSYDNPNVKKVDLRGILFSYSPQTYAMDINFKQLYWKKYNSSWNLELLTPALEQANVKLNADQLNDHMMNPESFVVDKNYQANYKDLEVVFSIKKQKGLIFYTLMEGNENYKKYRGSIAAVTKANNSKIQRVHYSMPTGEYALAAFHDLNSNSKLDKFIGFPSEPTAFSNGAKAFFGPPKFQKVSFNLEETTILPIQIK
ncbi:MAG: choloylglycine hydrolase [Vicingaceae bacterium]|jgi:choloylglycine hydrolase